jgi:acetolactate synthase-1/2/3 large subunit
MRGADLLVKALTAAGVTKVFSLSGNQIMPIYDACLDANVGIIHTRHEAAAVFMADAYAQLSGQIGVCLVTAAPGAANALGPLFSARQSESAVLFLSGDSPLEQDGRGAFQELDQVSMTTPLTKSSFRAQLAENLGIDMLRAVRTASSGRPGPVHVVLPFDVVEGDATDGVIPGRTEFQREHKTLSNHEAELLFATLLSARSPLILCGPALAPTRSGNALAALADVLDAPVIAMESPRGLKDPALGIFAEVLAKADLVISMGKSINFMLDFCGKGVCSPSCQWIMIDIESCEHQRAVLNLGDALTLQITADPRDVVTTLIETSTGSRSSARKQWRETVTALTRTRNYDAVAQANGNKITPAALCVAVQRQVEKTNNSIVLSDGGEFGQWSQAGTNPTRRIINGPSGAIGGVLCYAIAARIAKPDATVFALMGDGTVGFHLAEFETAVRENIAFVVIIGNDQRWNAEHQIQLRNYGADRLIGCQLSGARYDRVVVALGGHGEYVTQIEDLDAALCRAIDSGIVACVNVMIEGLPAPG